MNWAMFLFLLREYKKRIDCFDTESHLSVYVMLITASQHARTKKERYRPAFHLIVLSSRFVLLVLLKRSSLFDYRTHFYISFYATQSKLCKPLWFPNPIKNSIGFGCIKWAYCVDVLPINWISIIKSGKRQIKSWAVAKWTIRFNGFTTALAGIYRTF